jgi:hypothetical protein
LDATNVGAGLVPARISEADNQDALSFKIEATFD